jgi:hypothetical protein
MSNVLIALLISLGLAAWLYAKMMRNSGGLKGNAFTVAAITAGVTFLIVLTVLDFVFRH